VNISKNLNIESKDHLYKLINKSEKLSSNKIFTVFMDKMYILYNGCSCSFDFYEKDSNVEYINISNNVEAFYILREYFKCDGIIFN
jgi:uncharacterized protein YjgD (DUF1641 family)